MSPGSPRDCYSLSVSAVLDDTCSPSVAVPESGRIARWAPSRLWRRTFWILTCDQITKSAHGRIVRWYKNRPLGIRVAIIGGVFTIVAALIPALLPRICSTPQRSTAGSELRLVDLTVADEPNGALLDLKLRNVGATVAFVKRIEVSVSHIWILRSPVAFFLSLPSAKYDLLLPTEGAPYVRSVPISQVVPPNETDRFELALGGGGPPSAETFVFHVQVVLIYDEDDRQLSVGPVVFATDTLGQAPRFYSRAGEWGEKILEDNRAILAEVDRVAAVKTERVLAVKRTLSSIRVGE